MTLDLPNMVIKLLLLSSFAFIASSCDKNDDIKIDIIGEYCTYRIGPTGHATSTMKIVTDTTERNDIIISNISGYDNTSEAFQNIPCDRVNNRLIIPESVAFIGNSDTMVITGEGTINSDGTISLDINTNTATTENNFTIYLNNNDSFSYFGSYSGGGHSLVILANQIDIQLTTEEEELLSFSVVDSDNQTCSIEIDRHSLLESTSSESYLLEAEIYFGGDGAFGTISYSNGGWQSAKSIELNLE